ncbi:hypothetical protein [Actinosynnema sp. NPDC023587]|uniref:hypothetical protein n=1 Tax=Actinosynnema sp. NPDC023587 TaxID=3154695 RepID=UPI00340701F0
MGSRCPKLAQRNHGAWQVRQELAPALDGTRRTFRRDGYETKAKAQTDLDRVRELLALAEPDDPEDREAISAMLAALDKRERLPETETVRRQLKAGLPLADKGTIGEWLDTWHGQERTAEPPRSPTSRTSGSTSSRRSDTFAGTG